MIRFVHNFKEYRRESMYPINPYIIGKKYSIEPLIAPVGFSVEAQPFDIYTEFKNNSDTQKKLIVSVDLSASSTTLSAVSGRYYIWGETVSSVKQSGTITSGSKTWTANSTDRFIIICDSASNPSVFLPSNSVWCYVGSTMVLGANNCTLLKYVHRDPTVVINYAYDYRFTGCTNLEGIFHVPANMTSVPLQYFLNCAKLTGWSGHANITSIGLSAFQGCSQFRGSLPPGLLSIGTGAFSGCILSGSIPTTINQPLGTWAFSGCYGLIGTPYIPSNQINLGAVFRDCSGLTGTANLPTGLIKIADSANYETFRGCTGITRLNIPSTCTHVGGDYEYACMNMTSLMLIYCYAVTPPVAGVTTFHNVPTSCVVHVKAGTISAYRAIAQWNRFTTIIDDL